MIGPPASLEQLKDPVVSAKVVGLNYVTDESPGIARVRMGQGFQYRNSRGRVIRDPPTLRRIKSLAIPPAWIQVWICANPNGHLQATGRDDRRRKQFRYHSRWREIRDETKYTRMIIFAQALPRIRKQVARDLALAGLPRNKVLAVVVRLLELSLIRVGNEEYARENASFGLTTLRDQHVNVRGSRLQFHFRGKSGKWHSVAIEDRRLARIVKNCQDLPGQELFQFVDEEGDRHLVRSEDVNDYLRTISGEDFTAKDFRTWAGTVLAAMALLKLVPYETRAAAKKNIVSAIELVAGKLGNTPAVCRKCYIHPHVIDSYLEGTLKRSLGNCFRNGWLRPSTKLRAEEKAVLRLLRRRVTIEEKLVRSIRRESKRVRRRNLAGSR